MARQLGTYTLSSNIEMNAGAPLDARDIVPAKSDLTASGAFPYAYIGMETYVVAENKKYRLIGSDPTDISNWEEVGSGSGAGAIKGYYNSTDGKFYEESTYTTEITPDAALIYLDLSTENLYDYDGSAYTRIDPIDSQVPTITEASSRANIAQGDSIATVLGKVKKYFADLGDLAYESSVTSGMVTTALGYTPYDSSNPDGYISVIDSSMVTTALGYTPYDSASAGTAAAKNFTTSVTQNSTDLVTSGAVWNAIDNLPEPMVFKGTLGTGGTITDLPTAAAANEGFTYKVITAGTYASIVAKAGDVFTSNGSEWVLIPSGDTDSDTWRAIKVNGTEKLGSAISTGAVDFVNGTNTTASFDATGSKISFSATDAKVTCEGVNPSSETSYSAVIVPRGSNTTNQQPKVNTDLTYYIKNGTATVTGYNMLELGNGTSSGTAGNKLGILKLYSEKNGNVTLRATGASTNGRDIYFPDAAGTVALTSNIPTKLSQFTNDLDLLNTKNYTGGTAYTSQSEKSSVKFFLVRRNTSNIGIESNAAGGVLLSANWESSTYNAELFIGMGDRPGIYYRGNDSTGYTSWSQLANTSEIVKYRGNLSGTIGSGTPIAATKTYWTDNVSNNDVNIAYNTSGSEYTIIFSRGGSNKYGTILKYGYEDKYMYIARNKNGTWQANDWEKMSAGYADTAGSATDSTKLPLAGGTMTGALNFVNGTANKVGDDVQIGDYNKGGSLGVQGLNGNTSIKLIKNGASWASASEGGMILYNSTSKSLDFIFE